MQVQGEWEQGWGYRQTGNKGLSCARAIMSGKRQVRVEGERGARVGNERSWSACCNCWPSMRKLPWAPLPYRPHLGTRTQEHNR